MMIKIMHEQAHVMIKFAWWHIHIIKISDDQQACQVTRQGIHVWIWICRIVCMRMYMYTCAHVSINTYVHMYVYICVCMGTCECRYISFIYYLFLLSEKDLWIGRWYFVCRYFGWNMRSRHRTLKIDWVHCPRYYSSKKGLSTLP